MSTITIRPANAHPTAMGTILLPDPLSLSFGHDLAKSNNVTQNFIYFPHLKFRKFHIPTLFFFKSLMSVILQKHAVPSHHYYFFSTNLALGIICVEQFQTIGAHIG